MENERKLLEGLGNMDIAAVGEYMANTCIYAQVHIGRCRGSLALPPGAVGVRKDKMTTDARNAYGELVRLGTLTFIPRELENSLNAIESRTRRSLNLNTTKEGLMPAASYAAFAAQFEKNKGDYMALRDQILDDWDNIIAQFERKVTTMMAGIRMLERNRKKLRETIMSTIPSKDRYRRSFSMDLYVRSFPASPSYNPLLPKEVNEAIARNWKESTAKAAEQSVAGLLDEAFEMANEAVLSFLKKGAIHGRRVNALMKMGERLDVLNIFANPVITEVAKTFRGLTDDDDANEQALERSIRDIYIYMYSVGHEPNMDNVAFDEETFASFLKAAA